MDLHSRRAPMDATWKCYRQASRASKTRILDESCKATGYHRKGKKGTVLFIKGRFPQLANK